MQKTIVKYICDICHQESDDPKSVKPTYVLGKQYDGEGHTYVIGDIKVDMCIPCRTKLYHAVCNGFAEVSESSIGITAVPPTPAKTNKTDYTLSSGSEYGQAYK